MIDRRIPKSMTINIQNSPDYLIEISQPYYHLVPRIIHRSDFITYSQDIALKLSQIAQKQKRKRESFKFRFHM